MEVQFGRYQKIFCRSDLWSKISHVCSLKRFPHKFTNLMDLLSKYMKCWKCRINMKSIFKSWFRGKIWLYFIRNHFLKMNLMLNLHSNLITQKVHEVLSHLDLRKLSHLDLRKLLFSSLECLKSQILHEVQFQMLISWKNIWLY